MREIKFRLPHFNIKDGLFSHFSYWGAITHDGVHSPDGGSFMSPAQSNGTRKGWHQQFTGLKDKNGKEIYEGDILRFATWSKENKEVVKYEGAGFYPFTDPHYCDDEQGDPINEESLEVIGNIYL